MKQLHNHPFLKQRRKDRRNNCTPAEAILWRALKGKKVLGVKFRRQHSVGRYILDFYTVPYMLAIELDGTVHDSPAAQIYDEDRTRYLERQGIKVIRFRNERVYVDLEGVLEEIARVLKTTTPGPS